MLPAQNAIGKHASETLYILLVPQNSWGKQAVGNVRALVILEGNPWSRVRIPKSLYPSLFPSLLWLTMSQNGDMLSEYNFFPVKTGVDTWNCRSNLFSDVTVFPCLLAWDPHEFSLIFCFLLFIFNSLVPLFLYLIKFKFIPHWKGQSYFLFFLFVLACDSYFQA